MTSNYDHHDKDTLVRLLERRDAERQLGLVWERENDEVRDHAIDFVVSLIDRRQADGIALLEVKGSQWWGVPHEVEKAGARHADYGDVFMVGRSRGQSDFVYLRALDERLQSAGGFDIAHMRW